MTNKRLIFIGLAVGMMVGLYYFVESKRKRNMGIITEHMPQKEVAETLCTEVKNIHNALHPASSVLSSRDKKELQDRIKAMTLQEQEAILEVIPVALCMKRIQDELDRSREFESMIKKAYDMKQ